MALLVRKETAPKHSVVEDVAASTMEAVALAAKTVVEGLATGIIEVGEATPIVAPLFVALKLAKEMFDGVKRHREQLEELHDQCTVITTHIIIRCNAQSSKIDIAPLKKCVADLMRLATSYSVGGTFAKVVRYRRDKDRIDRLRRDIEALVPIMGLGGVVRVSEQLESVQSDIDQIADAIKAASTEHKVLLNRVVQDQHRIARDTRETREDLKTLLACTSLASPKLSAVPAGTPKAKGWHVVRNAVVDDIYNHFVAEGSPWMVGLVGRSGSGKTTAAAMVVRHGMGVVRPLDGETHQQALGRLSRVRALFSDGVVWLRVGRDAAERLPSLMQSLALMVYENVLHSRGYPPGQSPTDPKNGTAYVQEAMHTGLNFQGLQCLLVADDVWEPEVVQELRKTGMRVLLTTRDPVLVDDAGGKAIMVERLRREEAEALVASAAELPEGARLPEPVNELFELCDYMPMYVESVARWTVVNKRSDGGSWSKAMTVIRRYLDKVQEEHFGNDDDVSADKDPSASKRVAILRAGFECLGAEDSQSRWLYLALAVMPGGHAFEVYEACVLLFGHEHSEHDLERTGQVVAALERWAIITALGPGLFRMHDARSEFARRTLVNIREDIRRETVERWQAYLSTLEVVRSVDAYGLLGLWQAVELVGGEELHTLRPYDSTLSALDSSDPLYFSSAAAVAELYNINRDFHGAEAVMRKLWERCEGNPEANPHASLTALWHCEVSVRCRDEVESRRLRGLMEPLMDVAKERLKSGGMDAATCESVQFLHMLGLCYRTLERVGEAELWFRRALKTAEEANLDADSAKIADARVGLAQCLSESGRLQEAEGLFRQSLQSTESRLGISAVYVTLILDELAWCLTRLDRVGEAEPLFRRSLAIKEARLGTEHVRVIYTLHDLARCLIRLERAGEAEALFRRALAIKEAKLGTKDVQVAYTLHELARCLTQLERTGEAEALFRRALAIKEARLGMEDISVAYTLHGVARCLTKRDRVGDAEALFRRALAIKVAILGTEDVQVAFTLHDLAGSLSQLQRTGEAEALFRRALAIKQARLGTEHVEIAYTLHELGGCLTRLDRAREAEALFRRALAIGEARLGTEHEEIAYTLHELARCLTQLERAGEAEALFRRVLAIKEAKLGAEHVEVAYALHDMARCLTQLERAGEAEALFRRALAIKEARLGTEDVQVAYTLHEMARCLTRLDRAAEAKALFRRALAIKEARLGTEHVEVANTPHDMARCLTQLERAEEAEALFWRALAIKQARLVGTEDVQVAYTLHELARCFTRVERAGEVEALFRRALAIELTTLEASLCR